MDIDKDITYSTSTGDAPGWTRFREPSIDFDEHYGCVHSVGYCAADKD